MHKSRYRNQSIEMTQTHIKVSVHTLAFESLIGSAPLSRAKPLRGLLASARPARIAPHNWRRTRRVTRARATRAWRDESGHAAGRAARSADPSHGHLVLGRVDGARAVHQAAPRPAGARTHVHSRACVCIASQRTRSSARYPYLPNVGESTQPPSPSPLADTLAKMSPAASKTPTLQATRRPRCSARVPPKLRMWPPPPPRKRGATRRGSR